MAADLNERPEGTDVINAYRLALGRDPEAPGVVDEKLDQSSADLLPDFSKSPRVPGKVYNKALLAERFEGAVFGAQPDPGLANWAADVIPLSPENRDNVRASTDWYAPFYSLLADEIFARSVLGEMARTESDPLLVGLAHGRRAAAFSQIEGEVEVVSGAFPVEGNDTKYCLRLRSQGYRILYDPYATLYPLESKSRGYNLSEAKRRSAEAAGCALRECWGADFESDAFYNPHFDRLSPPFSRLQPPPCLRG